VRNERTPQTQTPLLRQGADDNDHHIGSISYCDMARLGLVRDDAELGEENAVTTGVFARFRNIIFT